MVHCMHEFVYYFPDEAVLTDHCMHEFVYYFPDEAVLTDHCYWFGPWYWYY